MKSAEYRHKYQDLRRQQTLQKALKLQNIFLEMNPHCSEQDIRILLSQCAHYHYNGRKQPLCDEAKVIYEYLVMNEYNPFTVYKWFLLFVSQKMLDASAEQNKLSFEQLRKSAARQRQQQMLSKSWKFLQEAKNVTQELMSYV